MPCVVCVGAALTDRSVLPRTVLILVLPLFLCTCFHVPGCTAPCRGVPQHRGMRAAHPAMPRSGGTSHHLGARGAAHGHTACQLG